MDADYTVTKKGHKLSFWSVVDDYAFALGQLCMAWSALDHDLQDTFRWLANVDGETAAIITTGLERVEARATPIKGGVSGFKSISIAPPITAGTKGMVPRLGKRGSICEINAPSS